MTEPTISISAVIPAYNAEKYIARTLNSVLSQTVPVREIVVVDDGSTDATAGVVRSFGEAVTLIQQPNAGVSAARNTGIRAAKGDWIAFLDADDEWLPEKIELQVELLHRNSDLMWVTGNYRECLCDQQRQATHTDPHRCAELLKGKEYYESYLDAVQVYEWGHTDCMCIRKSVFGEVGLFNTQLPVAEDLDLWLRIAYRYPKVGFVSQPLAVYHLTVTNSLMTASCPKSLYADFIKRHFDIAKTEGVLDELVPAAGAIMRRWIRGFLFQAQKEEIRELLTRFPNAFSSFYRSLIQGLTAFPMLTASCLHLLSKIIRALKLSRRLKRRPVKP